MGDGFRNSESDRDTKARDTRNPWIRDDEKPAAQVGYGDQDSIAPAARGIKPVDPSLDGPDPNRNDPKKPWRAGQQTAPATDSIVPVDPSLNSDPNRGRGNPFANGGRAGFPDSTYRGPEQQPTGQLQPGVPDWRRMVEEQEAARRAEQGQQGGQQPLREGINTPNSGLNPVAADTRRFIDRSGDLRTSVTGFLATGALSGAATNGLMWGADTRLASIPAAERTGLLKWWEKRSPMLAHQTELTRQVTKFEDLRSGAFAQREMAAASLPEVTKAVKSISDGLGAKITAGGEAEAINLMTAQKEFLSQAANYSNLQKAASALGTAEEVAAGKAIFVKGSEEAAALTKYGGAFESHTKAVAMEEAAAGNLKRAHEKLTQATEAGPGGLGGKLLDGAAKGALISAGVMGAGYAIDKTAGYFLGYEPKTDAMGRFALDGVVVPALLLSPWQGRTKYFMAGAAFLSARAADYIEGTGGSVELSSALRPNLLDAVSIPAIAMLPMDGKTKAASIGVAWLAGRAYNGIARATGWDGNDASGKALRAELGNAFTHDGLVRTEKSFGNAVDKAKALGLENEASLELEMVDYQSTARTRHQVEQMRGVSVLAAGLGEFRLEGGSRLDPTTHADKVPRILKGYDYDFGGEALMWSRMSAGSLYAIKGYIANHPNEVVNGQKMDATYDQQINNELKRVEGTIEKIYGEHNIEEIYDVLKKEARTNNMAMDKALHRIGETYSVERSQDARASAKTARDLALGYLAMADRSVTARNGEDANLLAERAVQYLNSAAQLDPTNKDLPKIQKIARGVAKGVPAAIESQWDPKQNRGNPFELKRNGQ